MGFIGPTSSLFIDLFISASLLPFLDIWYSHNNPMGCSPWPTVIQQGAMEEWGCKPACWALA